MYKSIKGYEGSYEVNEFGQVRSVDRELKSKNGSVRKYDGKELKPKTDKAGYFIIGLHKNGILKMMAVHRLVAEAFLPNPDNLPEVHHLNHDTKDNRACNLQWVTRAEQMDKHWIEAQLKAQGTKLRVVGNGIDKIFISAMAVKRELGINNSYAIEVAKGKHKQAKGYKIYFADQETNNA